MDSAHSPDGAAPVPVKIVVAGGFAVGKTTTVAAISEIAPLTTEAEMTVASVGVDEPALATGKTTTTVAMDFGCVTIDRSLKLYLFGTPGQSRFGFMWDDLARGALGALVVVDSTRLDDCFPAVDYFERRALPFLVAVNCFAQERSYGADEVARALDLDRGTPVVLCDARDRDSGKEVLIRLVEHAGRRHTARRVRPAG